MEEEVEAPAPELNKVIIFDTNTGEVLEKHEIEAPGEAT